MSRSTTEFATRIRGYPTLSGRMAAITLLFVAAGIAVSGVVAAGAGGEDAVALFASAGIVATVGALGWVTTRAPDRISVGSTFAAVAVAWGVAAVAGALPFVLADTFPRLDDALFESVSGFTGTGSTVLAPIQTQGRGILFWRSTTQWLGGMGIVVLAVAVLPFLGVGGMDLLRAEAPGPTSDRLAPRVRETAKRLWLVYGAFTVLAFVVLWIVGLSVYDATVHAFTVVSTGGLSPYDNSIGHFDSVAVEVAFIGLMLIGGANFTLHWLAVRGRPLAHLQSSDFRIYLGVFAGASAILVALLIGDGFAATTAVRQATFNVTTLLTSSGFGTADFVEWVPAAQLLLLGLMLSGGMAGSTSGGIKLIRVRIALAHARRDLRKVAHPRAVLPLKLRGTVVNDDITGRVLGFVLLYFVLLLVGTVVVAGLGHDLATAGGSVASMMGNMGPGLGESGPASNFLVFTRPARGVLMFLMLAGRLEMFPLFLGIGATFNRLTSRRAAG